MSEREDVDALLACLPMSDDGTGHIVDCGYDDEAMTCGCYTLPERLAAVLAAHDEAVRVSERVRLAGEVAGTRFRIETACDGYANLTIDDIPGDVFTEDDYMAGAADAANAIRTALAPSPGVRLTEEA